MGEKGTLGGGSRCQVSITRGEKEASESPGFFLTVSPGTLPQIKWVRLCSSALPLLQIETSCKPGAHQEAVGPLEPCASDLRPSLLSPYFQGRRSGAACRSERLCGWRGGPVRRSLALAPGTGRENGSTTKGRDSRSAALDGHRTLTSGILGTADSRSLTPRGSDPESFRGNICLRWFFIK